MVRAYRKRKEMPVEYSMGYAPYTGRYAMSQYPSRHWRVQLFGEGEVVLMDKGFFTKPAAERYLQKLREKYPGMKRAIRMSRATGKEAEFW